MKACEEFLHFYNNISASYGYSCLCAHGISDSVCQFDNRPCKATTCWNNGSCLTMTNSSFVCACSSGWHGLHCETRINYCENITCLNNGVCRSLPLNYTCECLTSSFSGRYCEQKANYLVVKEMTSKTLAYIAILAICSVALFIIVLDVLKYGFDINPVRQKLKRCQKQQVHTRPKPPVVVRFTYVH